MRPDDHYAARLSALAQRERFLEEWSLVGSMVLIGDLDGAKDEIAKLFRGSLERTARRLAR
jgi:hypothetical protein